jgi:hypothetical protein
MMMAASTKPAMIVPPMLFRGFIDSFSTCILDYRPPRVTELILGGSIIETAVMESEGFSEPGQSPQILEKHFKKRL